MKVGSQAPRSLGEGAPARPAPSSEAAPPQTPLPPISARPPPASTSSVAAASPGAVVGRLRGAVAAAVLGAALLFGSPNAHAQRAKAPGGRDKKPVDTEVAVPKGGGLLGRLALRVGGEDVQDLLPKPRRSLAFGFETRAFAEAEAAPLTKAQGPWRAVDDAQRRADCYFAASIDAVAEALPGHLESLVRDNGDGTYDVTLFRPNVWGENPLVQTVDGRLPSVHLDPRGEAEGALLTALIEKAMARWAGSYEELDWGNPKEALQNLTGVKADLHLVNGKSADAIFDLLEAGVARGYPMVTGTADLLDEPAIDAFLRGPVERANARITRRNERRGTERPLLVEDPSAEGFEPRGLGRAWLSRRMSETETATDLHCYSVVDAYREQVAGEEVRMVKLRDPRRPDEPFTMSLEDYRAEFFHLEIVPLNPKRVARRAARRAADHRAYLEGHAERVAQDPDCARMSEARVKRAAAEGG